MSYPSLGRCGGNPTTTNIKPGPNYQIVKEELIKMILDKMYQTNNSSKKREGTQKELERCTNFELLAIYGEIRQNEKRTNKK